MKKISLKNLNLKEVEQLTRAQLKDVLGGFTGTSGSTFEPTTTEDCWTGCEKPGNSCTTSDCKSGTCSYRSGSYVCT